MNLRSLPAADAPPTSLRPEAATRAAVAPQTCLLVLSRLARGSIAWGWWRIVCGPKPLLDRPGLRFAKVLGSGANGGFGLEPSATVQGAFLVFDEDAPARRFLAEDPWLAEARERSDEFCTALLKPISCRGTWDGTPIACGAPPAPCGPVAALTRASIRPSRIARFWRRSPAAEVSLGQAPGCLLAVGLGEAPLVRQATFSVWENQAAMDAYARTGAHLEAIRASQREGHFSESMFVRFEPLELRGRWQGVEHG